MLLYPAIDLLKTKVDSKYTLAIMAAKRARDLIDGKPKLLLTEINKPISVATAEIADNLISYKRYEREAASHEDAVETSENVDSAELQESVAESADE